MKFQVTYRLTHPEYLSTTSYTTLSAQTHQTCEEVGGTRLCTPHPRREKETPSTPRDLARDALL